MRAVPEDVCPDDGVLRAVATAGGTAASAPVQAHLTSCPRCSQRLESLSSPGREDVTGTVAPPSPALSEPLLPEGTKVGRYLVLQKVGAGGMGVVYAAYDAALNRKVALKLVRKGEGLEDDTAGRNRLLREGQALAQLSHPNVVPIFELGAFEDRVFIAMEFVEGQTLREWLATSRTWREVVSVFLDAGSGLSAAHAAGIIHRDFKLENVLLGKAGRVFVMDFGIARASEGRAPEPSEQETQDSAPTNDLLASPLTQVGAIVGTWSYMAPELFEKAPADARSDQFSFCVGLYRALYGDSPFRSSSLKDPDRWRVRPPPRGSKVPRWLQRLVERGLQVRPEERFPSMEALLAELRRDRGQTPRRIALGVGAGLVLAVAAGTYRQVAQGRAQLCKDGASRIASSWDPQREAALRQAFFDTRHATAESSWTHTRAGLAAFVERWATMHDDACAATRLRGEQSDEVLSLRMECLDRRLTDFKSALGVLSSVTGDSLPQMVKLGQGLRSVDICADVAALRAPVRPPDSAEARAEVARIQKSDSELMAKAIASRLEDGLALAQRNVDDAAKLGYRPLEAEVLNTLASYQQRSGDLKTGIKTQQRVIWAAEAGGHLELAARAAADAAINTARLGQTDAARDLVSHARAFLERLGGNGDAEIRLENAVGHIESAVHNLAGAEVAWQRARTLSEKVYGRYHAQTGIAINNVGIVLGMLARYPECAQVLKEGLDVRAKVFGWEHPETAMSLHNLGMLEQMLGNYVESVAFYKRANDIQEVTLGAKHHLVGISLEGMAESHMALGEYPRARELMDRVTVMEAAILGPTHRDVLGHRVADAQLRRLMGHPQTALEQLQELTPHVKAVEDPSLQASLETALGQSLTALGRDGEAKAHHERCVALKFAASDEGAQAGCDEALGAWLLRHGDAAQAELRFARAVALTSKSVGAESSRLASPLFGLADAQLRQGRRAQAREAVERGLKLAERARLAPALLGAGHDVLARLTWADGGRQEEALALARRAVGELAGPGFKQERAAVEKWLARPPAR